MSSPSQSTNRSLTLSKLSLTRIIQNIEEAVRTNNFEATSVLALELETEYRSYRNAIESVPDSLNQADIEEYQSFSQSYTRAKILARQPTSNENEASRTRSSEEFNRLPIISLPKFNGKLTEWANFRDIFVSTVAANRSLSDAQRLQYLKSSLIDDAAAAIRAIAITNANFNTAWNILEKRYNRPDAVTRSIINDFLNVNAVSHNHSNVKIINEKLSETLQLLNSQGEYACSRDPWIIFLTVSKFDNETRKKWAAHVSSTQEPKITDLSSFLEKQSAELDITNDGSQRFDKKGSFKVAQVSTVSCHFCQDSHSIFKCPAFSRLSVGEREDFVSREGRCYNCLSKSHNVKSCTSTHSCSTCKRKHHSLLHKSTSRTSNSSKPQTSSNVNTDISINTVHSKSTDDLLPTVYVKSHKSSDQACYFRALLDSGAQRSLISESLAKRLNLKRSSDRIPFKCVSDRNPSYTKGRVSLTIYPHFQSNFAISIHAHIVPEVLQTLPAHDVCDSQYAELISNLRLADPFFNKPKDVEMILSASIAYEVQRGERYLHKLSNSFVQKTAFGHVLCSRESQNNSTIAINAIIESPPTSLDCLVERFWKCEEPPSINSDLSADEVATENHFKLTTTRLGDGRFSVSLPFNPKGCLPTSTQKAAKNRFFSLERQFASNPDFHEAYIKFMTEYESLGHMTNLKCTIDDLTSDMQYVTPHHGIWQTGPTGQKKLRVVFDASAKAENNISLNDALLAGPALQIDVIDVLLNFRIHRFVATADIEKMYRQVEINLADRKHQLIVWRKSRSDPLNVFQLNTITYGQKSSPYLALRVLRELVEIDGGPYETASRIISKHRFVDDILFGQSTIKDLKSAKSDLVQLLGKGGFTLKKWASNSPELLSDLPENYVIKPLPLTEESSRHVVKTLGLFWRPDTDVFSFDVKITPIDVFTKRALLADTAKLFDPLGFISPVILQLKILFQETWVQQLGWDDELPSDTQASWISCRSSLISLNQLSLPRFLDYGNFELHGFADASSKAYAAVVYSRVTLQDKTVTRLLISKSKLAPIKQISIPRLELCAAQLLAQIVHRLQKIFEIPTKQITLWSDSEIVLAWIRSMPRKWSTYVGNRVGTIQSLCPNVRWRHVKSQDNPADLASRGCNATFLTSCGMWWQGPLFLQKPCIQNSEETFKTEEEIRPSAINTTQVTPSYWPCIIKKFSSFDRLVNCVSYVFRFVQRVRYKKQFDDPNLTASEVFDTTSFLIKAIQIEFFQHELDVIQNKGQCPKGSSLVLLRPYIDSGILRIGGRLEAIHSETFNSHPIILPRCHFSDLIIERAHIKTLHGGLHLVASFIRKDYWIMNARASIKKILHRCVRCSRFEGGTFMPPFASLPAKRITPSKPFLHVGIDFAGPVSLRPFSRRGNTTQKGYIAVIVCLATKAVHLELVMSLETESLILCLRRFLSRRGQCRSIMSDNGRTFVKCKRLLDEFSPEIEQNVKSSRLKEFLSRELITWTFIPPYTPNFGGLWESMVKLTKRHLNRTCTLTCLPIELFSTLLCEVENMINSRPITPIDFKEPLVPITPNHFLMGLTGGCSIDDKLPLLKKFDCLQNIIGGFWRRWAAEYLDRFLKCPKQKISALKPEEGAIVLIKRKMEAPREWKFARIERLLPGRDNICRVVVLRTSDGERVEAVRNLVPLRVNDKRQRGELC